MANITNIKLRNDETVHPIALPFAVCNTAATISPKTLTFSGGDTPTALVNGQQIMVQFANGNTTACSVSIGGKTPTIRLNNLSSGSIVPYIGAGAVVNLTYNNGNFYVSNAAALTGFEIPDTVTLATITNNGQLTKLTNNNIIGLTPDSYYTQGIENNSTIYNIVNKATIYHIYNTSDKTIKEITNSGIITRLDNYATITNILNESNGTITVGNNDGNITVSENHGYLDITNAAGTRNKGTGILHITNATPSLATGSSAARITQLINGGLVGRPDGAAVDSEGITNEATGQIRKIQNKGVTDLIENSNRLMKLVNTNSIGISPDTTNSYGIENNSKIYTIVNTNNATIYNISNDSGGNIKNILNNGNINTLDSNYGSITNFYIKSNGFVDTLTIATKDAGYTPAISTLNNNNCITTLNNNANSTISTLTNKGYISTLSNSGSGQINNLSNLTAKISLDLPPASTPKKYTISDVIGSGIWRIDPGFSSSLYAFIEVDNRDLGMYGRITQAGDNKHYIAQSSEDPSILLYGTAGSTSYTALNTGGDPYYVSPQGTGGSNCLLIIWETVSIGHDHGVSTHVDLTPGIYRIYYIKAVNKVYHYQIDKLNFGRL